MLLPKNKPIRLKDKKLRQLHEYVAERDPMCKNCGERPSREEHHIIFKGQGGGDTPRNLIGLCLECHDLAHEYKVVVDYLLAFIENEPERL